MKKTWMKFDFYQLNVTGNGDVTNVIDIFNKIINKKFENCFESSGYTRELFNLTHRTGPYNSFTGIFRKFRADKFPEVGTPGGQGVPVDLKPGEALIESNFFIFYAELNLLIWHVNGYGSLPTRFAEFMKNLSNTPVTVEPIIQANAVKELMKEKNQLKKIIATIARPTNPELYDVTNETKTLMQLLNRTNADRFNLTLAIDLRSNKKGVLTGLKDTVIELANLNAEKAVAVIEDEHGFVHPIDLIAQRLCDRRQVVTDKGYIQPQTMFNLIDNVYVGNQGVLNEYFGTMGSRIA